jgi:hypothetical protein
MNNNNNQSTAESLNLPLNSNHNIYTKEICGFPLKSATLIFSILMVLIESSWLYVIWTTLADDAFSAWYYMLDQSVVILFWVIVITVTILQDNILCRLVCACSLVITVMDFIWKFIQMLKLYERIPLDPSHHTLYYFSYVIYVCVWLIAAYVFYLYAYALNLGLLAVNQASSVNVSANTRAEALECNLIVQDNLCIVLTNPGDLAFIRGKQHENVNNVTLPSGIVVPDGRNGKNWRVAGNSIILF